MRSLLRARKTTRQRYMKDENSKHKTRKSRADSHELKLAGISYNVGPDAEDRLRRIFTILLGQAAREDGQPSDVDPGEDRTGEEA